MRKSTTIATISGEDVNKNYTYLTLCKYVAVRDVIFVYKCNFFEPTEGDYNTLGTDIEIKPYDRHEFLEFIGKNTVTLYFEGNHEHLQPIFQVRLKTYIDYPSTISFLQKKDLIYVRKSMSFIANDPRIFCVPVYRKPAKTRDFKLSDGTVVTLQVATKEDLNNINWGSSEENLLLSLDEEDKLAGEWYEVDILGTPYGKEITDIVISMYNIAIESRI